MNFKEKINNILIKLEKNIGKGPKLTNTEYSFLMENLENIKEERRIEFQSLVVKYLLSKKGKIIKCPNYFIENKKYPHLGEYFEYYIGLPQNPIQLGDLLGLELKVWAGKSQLSLTTYSILKIICKKVKLTKNEIICAKSRIGTKCSSKKCFDPNHIIKMNEGLEYDTPNRFNKIKYNVDDNNKLIWYFNENNLWIKLNAIDLVQKLMKFNEGLLLVKIKGNRSEFECLLEAIYYIPINIEYLINLIKNNEINYELRFKKDKKKGKWDGYSLLNPGWGFRLKSSWVKKNWMKDEYLINSVGKFFKLRNNLSKNLSYDIIDGNEKKSQTKLDKWIN